MGMLKNRTSVILLMMIIGYCSKGYSLCFGHDQVHGGYMISPWITGRLTSESEESKGGIVDLA